MSFCRRLALRVGSLALACGLGVVGACDAEVSNNNGPYTGAGGAAGQWPQTWPDPTLTAGTGSTPFEPQAGTGPLQTAGAGAGGAGTDVTAGMGAAGTEEMPIPQAGAGEAGAGGTAGVGGEDAAGAGGTAGAAGTGEPPTIDTCPAPPASASANAVEAWTLVNEYRLAAGAGCMNLVDELIASGQAHCDYMALNANDASCDAGAHGEVASCPGFTGADVQSREIAAGYPRTLAYTEVATTYGNNPTAAVPSWIDTVWHRIPLLDPWTTDMGWGGSAVCDVIDIGRGTNSVPSDTIVVYPYDGQTDVPPAFSGWEGPAPPPPPGGWPSAYPVNIYAQDISVTEHVVMRDDDGIPLDHLWLDYNSPEVGNLRAYFRNTAFLYGAPFELLTTYRVRMSGTHAGGAFTKEWTFTTGSTRPWGT